LRASSCLRRSAWILSANGEERAPFCALDSIFSRIIGPRSGAEGWRDGRVWPEPWPRLAGSESFGPFLGRIVGSSPFEMSHLGLQLRNSSLQGSRPIEDPVFGL